MKIEHYADASAPKCHEHWHKLVEDRFSDDYWSVEEGLLLLADLWPSGSEIIDSEVSHPRYGLLEPPVVRKAGLLNQECNIHVYENHDRLLVTAGKRLGEIQRKWSASFHGEAKYPPAFFVEWAKRKGCKSCWLGLWDSWLLNSLLIPQPEPMTDADSQNIEQEKISSQTEIHVKGRYIPKSEILEMKWPFRQRFNINTLEYALGNTKKPQYTWLLKARGQPGKVGKNGASTWNPALLADCLIDNGRANEVALRVFIRDHIPEWLDEFEKLRAQKPG